MSSNKETNESGNNTNENAGRASNKSITASWGGMHNFMDSHGIKRDPEGYQEANELIDAFRQADIEEARRSKSEK